jgi:hypothetical protein
VLQPDFRFWKARFAGKQCAQSRLVIPHCLTAPHSSNHWANGEGCEIVYCWNSLKFLGFIIYKYKLTKKNHLIVSVSICHACSVYNNLHFPVFY